ncbi:MAG: HDOD domain-containing protein, partial [Planctomycetota bacterium]
REAAVVLGLRAVKVMALSFWLVDDAQQSAGGDFDYRLYWRRSLTSAAVASLLSAHIPDVRADECFVAGLLADLGMLAAYHCVEDRYRPVLEQYATCSRPVQEIEAEVLGFTHARISAELLRRWSLPELLCDAIAAHHGEGAARLDAPAQSLAKALHASACIAELFCGDVEGTRLDEVKALCRELLSVPSEALETILEEVEQNVAEMASLFNVEIGEALSYDAIRRKAMVKMVNISMSAEMERVQAHKHADRSARSSSA